MPEFGSQFQSLFFASATLVVIVLVYLYFFFLKKRKTERTLFKFESFFAVLKNRSNINVFKIFYGLNKLLFISGLLLLIVGLARPQKRNENVKQNSEGINIMMVLDISDSMLIEDMKPENRLVCAKLQIKEFIEKRVSDRIGLVVFSGQSYTRVPLTLDYDLLLESLSLVQTSERVRKGTAIGVALANAVTRLESAKGESNVIVLLTDGENNVGAIDPITALEIAKEKNIRVYTVGIGKDGLAQLPIYRKFPNGMVQKYYRPMHSKVNEKLLKKIADETGGVFYRVTESNNLNEVFSEINELEKTEVEIEKITIVTELYSGWNFWGLIFIFISELMRLLVFWRIF